MNPPPHWEHRQQLLNTLRAYRPAQTLSIFLLWKHILPNTLTPVIVHTSLMMIGRVILTEASLAFLGLGDPNHISWGYLLNNAQPFLRTAWWMSFFPGLAIVLAVLGFNLVGDSLNDAWIGRSSSRFRGPPLENLAG